MDQSNDMSTKYDLIQRERVCDDIWLCTTRPTEKCYKPCKVHNPMACDGAGLPGVEWDDDDVFETDEEAIDSSFSDTDVWDSDVDTIEDTPKVPVGAVTTRDEETMNMEMERWMQIADLFYSQPPVQDPHHQPNTQPAVNQDSTMSYYPWNSIYPAGVPSGYQLPHPMLYAPMPAPHALPLPTSQDLNNMINNNPWAVISTRPPTQTPDNRGWDELIAEQERYQNEMAAAVAAQCVGATVECETISDTSSATTHGFSSSVHPQHAQQTTDFWKIPYQQHQQHVEYMS